MRRMRPDDLTVLLVEDSDSDADLLVLQLAKHGLRRVARVASVTDGLSCLGKARFDLVVTDLSLPDASGVEAVRAFVSAAPELPVVVMTGFDDSDLAIEAARIGAQDYFVKGTPIDVIVRKMREAVVREHRRLQILESKDGYLAKVSHELRSPLGAIIGGLQVLHDGDAGELSDEQHHFVDLVRRNVIYLRTLVEDLLDAEAIEHDNLSVVTEKVDAAGLVTETVDELSVLAFDASVRITTGMPVRLPEVWADRKRLKQVLTNLLMNAIDFTPAGGEVEVRLEESAGVVRFDVRDSGPGVPPEEAELIFLKHRQGSGNASGVRRGRSGVGLGLHIVREIVERQGGEVWVVSEPGSGATFAFTVPVAPQELPVPVSLPAFGNETDQEKRHARA